MGAKEAIVVPMSVLERDEFRTANTGDRFATGETTFREQFAETIGTIRFVVATSETCTG